MLCVCCSQREVAGGERGERALEGHERGHAPDLCSEEQTRGDGQGAGPGRRPLPLLRGHQTRLRDLSRRLQRRLTG